MAADEALITVLLYATVTVLLIRGEIFEPFKMKILHVVPGFAEEFFASVMYCSQCLGVWIGLVGLLTIEPVSFIHPLAQCILFPAAVSTIALLLDRVIYGREEG